MLSKAALIDLTDIDLRRNKDCRKRKVELFGDRSATYRSGTWPTAANFNALSNKQIIQEQDKVAAYLRFWLRANSGIEAMNIFLSDFFP